MKKYTLTLLTILISLATFGQNSHKTSEKTSCSVHESDTEFSIHASFPSNRTANINSVLTKTLGEATKSAGKRSYWLSENYSASFSPTSFKAHLDKKKANASETKLFAKIAENLQAALGQPAPPSPPKPPRM